MRSPVTIVLTVLVTVTIFGCASTSKVRTKAEPNAVFEGFSTFAVLLEAVEEQGGQAGFDAEVADLASQAVTKTMQAKGYRQAPRDQAELLVSLHGQLEDMVNIGVYNYKVPKEYAVENYPGSTQFEYRHATLTVDVVQRSARKLLWRGWAEKRLKAGQQPTPETVASTTSRILDKFPGEASN